MQKQKSKIKNIGKRSLKILLRTICFVLVLVYVLVALLNTTIIQSFTAAKVADFFSKEWKTKVEIGALNISPFIHAGLKDVYVEDLNKDTLVYASYIEANLYKINSFKHIIIRNANVEDLTCYMDMTKDGFNFQFILDYFKSTKEKEKKPSEPFVLEIKDINLKDIHYRLRRLEVDTPVLDGLFASNCIEVYDVNMQAKDFSMKGSDISLDMKHFQAKERCGIVLEDFTGEMKVSSKNISIKDGSIKTLSSNILWDVSMKTDSYHTYSSFMDSVDLYLNIKKGSYVGMQDACYWTERVQNAKQKVYLTTELSGCLNEVKLKQLDILSSSTHINLNGKIKGLPSVDDLTANLTINDITTSYEDFTKQQFGTIIPEINLPDIVKNVGLVNIHGNFDGGIKEFETALNLSSDVGVVDILSQSIPINDKTTQYKASVISPNLNLGHLLANNSLGHTTVSADAELSLSDNMIGNVKARMNNFYFQGNSYNDVQAEGDINGDDINALVVLSDELVDLSADCSITNYKSNPTIQLKSSMAKVDLHRMNLFSFADTNTLISADINADISSFDIDSLNGNLYIKNLNVITSNQDINVSNISITAVNDSCENTIVLSSDIIDADITGKYTLTTVQNDIDYLLKRYIPEISPIISDTIITKNTTIDLHSEEKYTAQSDLQFTSTIKDISLLKTLFDVDATLNNPINIQGYMNETNLLFCEMNIKDFEYAKKSLNNTDVKIRTIENELQLEVVANRFAMDNSMSFKNINIQAGVDTSHCNLLLSGQDFDNDSTNARIQFESYISDKGLQGNFTDTYVNIDGEKIFFNDNHIIGVFAKKVSVMNFDIMAQDSKITLDGLVSNEGTLNCTFSNVDLSLLNPFLQSNGLTLAGTLNKDVELRNITEHFSFTSSIEAEDLAINGVELGKAWLNVDNNLSPDILNAHIRLLYKTQEKTYLPLQLIGTISPNEEEDQMDLTLHMKDFELAVIKTFISSFASDVEGSLSCDNLTVKGKFSSPEIRGVIHANQAAMKINMLNTKYWFSDDIVVDNNKIVFDDFTLKDAQNNKITINGDVAHHNFSSFDINLHALADKIKILDTKSDNGQMYYGTAYASANMTIVGDSTMINISGSAKTEPGTSLTVPVSSKASAEENNFITFVSETIDEENGNNAETDKAEASLGYNISIDLNVNPNAKLFIPMDFTQLKGNLLAAGNGDLKIEMNSKGKFSMVGTVAIDNGNFKFNIMDVMEKSFILQQGGTLTWDGAPADGVMDVTAIYKTKTSLASLLGASYSRPVDVESIIHLTGQMTNPQPSFDIQLPNTDEQTAEQVFMQIDKTDEKVMLEQTASILLTNQFYYSQGGYETTALQSGVTSSVMGVAFSQLSGMISNMVKFVDVGLNYTSGGETLTDQVDLNLSKSFGKWEISVNSTFGGDDQTYTTSDASNIIGDLSAKYKYTDNLQFEVFRRSNANDFTKYNISPYTQGVKMIYKKDYDSVKDILLNKKRKKKL